MKPTWLYALALLHLAPAQIVPPVLNEGSIALAQTLSVFAATAYCPTANDERYIQYPGDRLTNVRYINGTKFPGVRGYVGTNQERIIVSFSGPNFMQPPLANDLVLTRPVKLNNGRTANINDRFMAMWASVSGETKSAVVRLLREYPNWHVFFLGHGVGGALATLAAIDIQASVVADWSKLDLYTYNCPRVGDAEFVNFIHTRKGYTSLRCVNDGGYFANLPSRQLGYRHPQYLAFYKEGKLMACRGPDEDPKCITSMNPGHPTDMEVMGTDFSRCQPK